MIRVKGCYFSGIDVAHGTANRRRVDDSEGMFWALSFG